MKICPDCNAQLEDDVKFCTSCGHSFADAEDPVVEPQETAYTEEQEAPAQEQQVSYTEATPTPVKKKSAAGGIIAVLVIICLLVGGFFLYKELTKTPYERVEEAIMKTTKQESYHSDVKAEVTAEGQTLEVGVNGDVSQNAGTLTVDVGDMLSMLLGSKEITLSFERVDDTKLYISMYMADDPSQAMVYVLDVTDMQDAFNGKNNKLKDYTDDFIDAIDKQLKEEDKKLSDIVDVEALRKAMNNILDVKSMKNYCTAEKNDDTYSFVINVYDMAKYLLNEIKPAIKDSEAKEQFEEIMKELDDKKDQLNVEIKADVTVEKGLVTKIVISADIEDYDVKLTADFSDFGKAKIEIPSSVKDQYKDAEELKGLDNILG